MPLTQNKFTEVLEPNLFQVYMLRGEESVFIAVRYTMLDNCIVCISAKHCTTLWGFLFCNPKSFIERCRNNWLTYIFLISENGLCYFHVTDNESDCLWGEVTRAKPHGLAEIFHYVKTNKSSISLTAISQPSWSNGRAYSLRLMCKQCDSLETEHFRGLVIYVDYFSINIHISSLLLNI
jgi:hypothetical protein